jgi:hypothetical protein
MNGKVVKPLRKSRVRETIVLETKSAKIIPLRPRGSDREWLARDIFSTPYATILED